MLKHDYIRDGAAIYERSFAIIRAESDLSRFTPEQADIAVRMIHACGRRSSSPSPTTSFRQRGARYRTARRSFVMRKWWRTESHARVCRQTTTWSAL